MADGAASSSQPQPGDGRTAPDAALTTDAALQPGADGPEAGLCPWCSTDLGGAEPDACPTCGAHLAGDPELSVPGVTTISPELERVIHVSAPPRRRFFGLIEESAKEESGVAPSSVEALEPPSDEIRLEMARLKAELDEAAEREAEAAAAAEREAEILAAGMSGQAGAAAGANEEAVAPTGADPGPAPS